MYFGRHFNGLRGTGENMSTHFALFLASNKWDLKFKVYLKVYFLFVLI